MQAWSLCLTAKFFSRWVTRKSWRYPNVSLQGTAKQSFSSAKPFLRIRGGCRGFSVSSSQLSEMSAQPFKQFKLTIEPQVSPAEVSPHSSPKHLVLRNLSSSGNLTCVFDSSRLSEGHLLSQAWSPSHPVNNPHKLLQQQFTLPKRWVDISNFKSILCQLVGQK